ncbi:hypothetical protein ABZP36_021637 [Zizania latifolia]
MVRVSPAVMALNLGFWFFLLFSHPILAEVRTDGLLQTIGGSTTMRNLLQAKKNCPVNFESQNYSIITSKCKSPYPANLCCAAFTEFACPFSNDLNDESNSCASTMFTYINFHGKYPPGLFANECKGDKNGLPCNNNQNASSTSSSGQQGAERISLMSVVVLAISGIGALLFY